jgi:hypothetical protein
MRILALIAGLGLASLLSGCSGSNNDGAGPSGGNGPGGNGGTSGSGGSATGGSSGGGTGGSAGTGGSLCTGECTPGSTETQACTWGMSERTCEADCTWGAFSACETPVGWRDMAPSSSANIPGRKDALGVWTGSVLFIFGGSTADLSPGTYDPVTNQWTKLPAAPVSGRPVWTGTELVLVSPDPAKPVARFDLATNTWSTLSGTLPIPKRDSFAFEAYLPATNEVMVWGGRKTSCPCQLSDGAAYSLTNQSWRIVSTGPLEPRDDYRPPGVVWTGSSLVIFGGGNYAGGRYHTGASYDPVADTWTAIPESPQAGYTQLLSFPLGPNGTLAAFWGGERFGGSNYNYPANDGAIWDDAAKTWTSLPGVPGGGAYNGHVEGASFAATTAFGLYGGTHYDNGFSLDGTGAVFDMAKSTYTELPPGGPSPRKNGVAVWTGTEAIVWGGDGAAGALDDGKIWRACGTTATDNAACTPDCGIGTFACNAGGLVCTSKPGTETCNGHDDDCDGSVDESIPSGGACSTGEQGICGAGLLQCVSGAMSCVNNGAIPTGETCNGLDDDCNGQIDNDVDGQFCGTGLQGACYYGVTKCTNGVPSCTQTVQPTTESCNGIDDDCDGTWDDGVPPTSCTVSGVLGPCAAGSTSCTDGITSCVQKVFPTAESCSNSVDDDCDGVVNDGC